MFSLVTFTGIWRHRKQARRDGDRAEEKGRACAGEYSEEYFPQDGLLDDYDPATANDLSYEEALLDSRVRRFMREEYERVEPPQGAFQRLMTLIKAERARGRERSATLFTRLFSSAYRALSGQTLSRLVPGGIAVAVLVVVSMGSSTSSLLRGGQLWVGVESTPVVEHAMDNWFAGASAQEQSESLHLPINPQSTLDVTGGEEAYIVNGGLSLNVQLQIRGARMTESPRPNRARLDPF